MKINLNKTLIVGALVIVIALIVWVVWRGQEVAERALVSTNDVTLSVRLADNVLERKQGLSGLEAADVKAQGMLFVFPEAKVQNFWMRGMKLPLDVLWIKNGAIVAVDEGIQPPKAGEEPVTMTSAPIAVDMVLELPAGYAHKFDLRPGLPLIIELP